MTETEWLVTLGGAAAIVWINWYFFFTQRVPPRAVEAARPEDDR